MSTMLNVSNVGKCYAAYRSNLARFANWFGASIAPTSEFWANRNVSFDAEAGEALALIGQNGAGKSTLLKIITGTVRPNEGAVTVAGRVSAILELGLGFNPEFTGRQNVFQAGGLMGFSQREINEMMPAIEDFAEIGDFFDQPARVYSSGMQARLAFALATAKRPDILIVDEVLAVGDSYFQHKCFDRIRQFKSEGTCIILVTHSMGDVRALCDRVILLDKGSVLKDGSPDEVVDYYNAIIAERENAKLVVEQKRKKSGWVHTRSGTFEATISNINLLSVKDQSLISTATVGQKLLLRIEVDIHEAMPQLVLGLMLRDRTGHTVWGTNTWHTHQVETKITKGQRLRFDISFDCELGPGSFSFSTAITANDTHLSANYEWQDNVVVFDVVNVDRPIFIGSSALQAEIEITRI